MNLTLPLALGSLLCPFMVFAVVVIVIIKLVRSSANSRPQNVAPRPTQSAAIGTELGADGFWILSCPVPVSSTIYFQYWSSGTRHTAQVPYQPGPDGRQFVYTGTRPEQVAIIRIEQPSDDGSPGLIIPGIIAAEAILNSTSSDDSSPPPPPPPPPSFPSAY